MEMTPMDDSRNALRIKLFLILSSSNLWDCARRCSSNREWLPEHRAAVSRRRPRGVPIAREIMFGLAASALPLAQCRHSASHSDGRRRGRSNFNDQQRSLGEACASGLWAVRSV